MTDVDLMAHLVASIDRAKAHRLGAEVDHIVCCIPELALCGANVAGQGVAFGNPEHSRTLCRICANKDADGERCGAKDCPGPERQE